MELNELLGLNTPTLKQLEEQERQLRELMAATQHELDLLNEEERASSAARLAGKDAGEKARVDKKLEILRRMDDAKCVLRQTQGQLAAERQRVESERVAQAWAKVRGLLARQTEAAAQADVLCDKLIELGKLMRNLNEEAIDAAPCEMRKDLIQTQNGAVLNRFHHALAIIAKVHSGLGCPMKFGGNGVDSLAIFERHVNADGVRGIIKPQQEAILSKAV